MISYDYKELSEKEVETLKKIFTALKDYLKPCAPLIEWEAKRHLADREGKEFNDPKPVCELPVVNIEEVERALRSTDLDEKVIAGVIEAIQKTEEQRNSE